MSIVRIEGPYRVERRHNYFGVVGRFEYEPREFSSAWILDCDMDEPTAKRIAGTLNACQGIPTDQLRPGLVAELVAACELALTGPQNGYMPHETKKTLRAVLAKMKPDDMCRCDKCGWPLAATAKEG